MRLQDALTGCPDGLCFAAAPDGDEIKITVHESVLLKAGQAAVIIDWLTVGRCLFEAGIRDDGTVDRQAMAAALAAILAGAAAREDAR